MSETERKKSVVVAYLLWFVGGWCSLHLFYLRRDRQAFVYLWSLGGYLGCGILYDFIRIPKYVRDANNDPEFTVELATLMKIRRKPKWSVCRAVGQMLVGNMWYLLVYAAVPSDQIPYMGRFTLELVSMFLAPMGAAVGVWAVGNIGHEQGKLRWSIIGSYAMFLVVPVFGKAVLTWCSVTAMFSFNKFGKQWRRAVPPKLSFCRRALRLSVAWLFFFSLLCSFLYFNATLETKGEKIKLRDAVGNFIRSPMFQEFKENAKKVYKSCWEDGFGQAARNFIELMDPTGSINALKVLELPRNATQAEIKDRVRLLSKQWHPDKHLGDAEKEVAQKRFMEIQDASNILLDDKRKRNRNQRRRTATQEDEL